MGVYTVNQTDGSLQRVAGGTLYADAPIASIIPFGGETAPAGWLICDGSTVSRTEYAELFAVIGINFGEGDGETTFGIPDLRECVPVGVGKNITKSIGAHDRYELGQFKDDQVQANYKVSFLPASFSWGASGGGSSAYGGTNANLRIGDNTHGKRLGVNYIIKAKMVGVPADLEAQIDADYQKKDLTSAVEGATTVEGALGALSTNKASKVSGATAGDIATLDANGNLVDSGVVASNVIRRINPSTTVDCNDLTDLFTEYRVGDGDANKPTTGFAYIIRVFKSGTASTSFSQIAYRIGGTSIYRRQCDNGTWTSWEKLVTESDLNPGTSKTDIDSNIVYYYRSGKVVTVVFNGIIVSSDVAQNARIGSLEFPHAVDSYGVYFTVADYNKNNAISVMRIDSRGYLLAASSASEQAKVVSGRYWGTVTYITG